MSQQPNKSAANGSKSPLKGLVGFLSGLVLATLIIIAVLLMINSNSKRDFKNTTEPVLTNNTPKTTETLVPNGQGTAVQLPQTDDQSSASQVLARANVVDEAAEKAASAAGQTTQKPTVLAGNQLPEANANTRFNDAKFDDEQAASANKETATSVETAEPADEPVVEDNPPAVVTKPTRPAKQPEQVATKPKPQPKPQPKPEPKPKRETPATTKKADPKPTPEQILESGNIEKAREVAKREANQGKKGNVVLQAGSFNSRDYAESQRAKLAILGVQAHVSEANVNGKTVYRVQTPKLSGEQATNAKKVLKSNGVGVYERSAN